MNDLIWAGIWAMLLKNAIDIAQMAGLALAWLIFALMCFDWAAKFYDKIKRESDLEPLLDTPQKRSDELMEGLTTFDFPEPEDEGPLTMICPLCGALYPSFKMHCNYDKGALQPFRKPITEPLKPVEMLEVPTPTEVEKAQIAAEQELQAIWTALEDKAREYNIRRPYTFSREEVISLRKVYDKVREQSQEEKRAS